MVTMRHSISFSLIAILLLLLISGLAFPGERKLHLVKYEGIINPVAAELVTTEIKRAKDAKAEALIIELDTPGGLDQSMRIIVKEIIGSDVPIVVYIYPSGARSASAGVFITLASHIAAMTPGTNIGAAHPVALGGGEMDKEMKKKVENDAAAYIKSIAEKRGRNAKWAEDAVRSSVSVTEKEALDLKIIDLVASNIDDLLVQIDGREVVTEGGKRVLRTKDADLVRIEIGLRLRILNALSDPNIAYILMIIGIYGLIFELSSPGAILPGVVGGISLILAFYSFQTLPINYAGLALIILGIICFIAEIKVTSYGLLAVGGTISMLLGSLMLINTDVPYLRISWGVIFPSVIATVLFFLSVVGMAVKSQRKKPLTGIEGLIGMICIAKTDISPRGQVMLRGEIWDAMSDELLKEGDEAEVLGVEGLKLLVKRYKQL